DKRRDQTLRMRNRTVNNRAGPIVIHRCRAATLGKTLPQRGVGLHQERWKAPALRGSSPPHPRRETANLISPNPGGTRGDRMTDRVCNHPSRQSTRRSTPSISVHHHVDRRPRRRSPMVPKAAVQRVRVPVDAMDPVSLTGLTAYLEPCSEVTVLPADQRTNAQVRIVATDRLTSVVVSRLRRAATQTGTPVVLVIDEISEAELLTAVE